MKKNGFTLAEVLITLGIIGVIAAITLPTLMTDTATAQIGPRLAKSVAMFEQANEALLNANSVDSLTDLYGNGAGSLASGYTNELTNHLKISRTTQACPSGYVCYQSKDGTGYAIGNTISRVFAGTTPPHKQRVGMLQVDLNGFATKPNLPGTDRFEFAWFDDGSLRAKGSLEWDGNANATLWTQKCPNAENGNVSDWSYCAGHVFENNLKVLYR